MLPDFDPPMGFEAHGIPLGTNRSKEYVFDDSAIYYTDNGTTLLSYELATGEPRLSTSFDTAGGTALGMPGVSDGRVYVTYVTEEAGTGTQAAQYPLHVAALDTETGETVWTTEVANASTGDWDPGSLSSPPIHLRRRHGACHRGGRAHVSDVHGRTDRP
ncbi:PQQ-binding-like beta-propeller repeat protein [Streptomyces sp. MP131-18]|uniref:outer membrane protein assembly factor BamB family protein n=1 Tax=Streptomyces sp. MP131-18 TaxID=1857892 RepID=UPI0009D5EA2D|nr:PQQ-binding-like beta-propeller repeat protein [Streptomyces sp. MP131-18]ONK14148.1 hypothetical protein STBA_49270 [Streptomyces sp. MP131-18]